MAGSQWNNNFSDVKTPGLPNSSLWKRPKPSDKRNKVSSDLWLSQAIFLGVRVTKVEILVACKIERGKPKQSLRFPIFFGRNIKLEQVNKTCGKEWKIWARTPCLDNVAWKGEVCRTWSTVTILRTLQTRIVRFFASLSKAKKLFTRGSINNYLPHTILAFTYNVPARVWLSDWVSIPRVYVLVRKNICCAQKYW